MNNNIIEIWQPRYRDRVCLVAKYKVSRGANRIRFTKAKEYAGMEFEVDFENIVSCPVESNGRIDCYAVPLAVVTNNRVV